jgi:sugar phosphate isomerase/epimerase
MDRRIFIKSAAAGAATLNLTAPASAADSRGMYITMRTQNGFWTPGLPPGTGAPPALADWEGLARSAKRNGYAGVDLPLAPSFQAGAEKVRAVLTELKLRTGFMQGRVNPFGRGDAAAFQESMKGWEEDCRFAAAIGCPRFMIVMRSSSDTPKEEWRKITLERAKAMSEAMERHGVKVGVEFFGPPIARKQSPHEFIYKMSDAVALCKEAGPNWGVCLDSWHWFLSGSTYQDIIDAGSSRIIMVHVNDAKLQAPDEYQDNQRMLAGEGIIPLDTFFRAIVKTGYEGCVSPEPLGRFGADVNADAAAKMTLQTTVAAMKKGGARIIPPQG